MNVELTDNGWRLHIGKKELEEQRCFSCGLPINELNCFICRKRDRLIHIDCQMKDNDEMKNSFMRKCQGNDVEHIHERINEIKLFGESEK